MKKPRRIILGSGRVGIPDVVAVARARAPVALSDQAKHRLVRARRIVERAAAGSEPIYGLTTGLGAGVDTRVAAADLAAFQQRTILARAVGVGPRLATETVRAMLFARLAGLARGVSGIAPAFA